METFTLQRVKIDWLFGAIGSDHVAVTASPEGCGFDFLPESEYNNIYLFKHTIQGCVYSIT